MNAEFFALAFLAALNPKPLALGNPTPHSRAPRPDLSPCLGDAAAGRAR